MKTPYPKIALQGVRGIIFVRKNEIIHAQAAGNYTLVHLTQNRKVRVLRKLKEVSQLLSDESFVRIHRSHLINLEHIVSFDGIQPEAVLLSNDEVLQVSRNRRTNFIEKFTRI